jgi:hypothetical protein
LIRNEKEVLSPEDVMWAAHELMGLTSREETSVELALFGLASEEETTEKAWPYGNPRWSAGRPGSALRPANRRPLPAWRRLPETSVPAIRKELEGGCAVILTLGVVRPTWLEPPAGLIDCPPGGTVRGNHAVAVVGVTEENELNQRLRIKNSWGSQWAEMGYALISERYLNAYGICAHSLKGDA